MASHGRNRSVALVGSVATEVVARGRDPVILVGPNFGDVAPWVEKQPPRGVVACVDEKPDAATLVAVGWRWAELLGEPLVVTTVAEPVPPPVDGSAPRRLFGPDGDVEEYLDSLVSPGRGQGVEVETQAVYDPVGPAAGLHDYLRQHPAVLAVMGSRARTGLARAVFGSVAAAVVYQSPSPVLIVPRGQPG
jgi:nucleotide-binding universal stress UspA family protein